MWYFWKGIYEVEVLISVVPYCMEETVKDQRAILRTVSAKRELVAFGSCPYDAL